jgi:serine/threonine-protein kinase
MAELPGAFGKYFLCDKIAAGGMAEIYLAKLIGPGGFEKQLVIKQINPELSKERQFVELFVAEAKTLVALSHGNIVPVYELGVVDDTYFIAMEYVDGPTLGELLAALERHGERLEPGAAAHVASELCKGLDYAHRKGEGVVHRDLSPRNVLLSREGEVKLVDFGLALAPAPDRTRRGQPGAAPPAGSFPYMSPEQVRRDALDQRSDLFSLGVLLWEMLTGEPLFARDDADATLEAVLHAPIAPPSQVHAGVPAELDRICLRALARDWGERYASAGDILAALSRFAYSIEPPVTQSTLAALIARVSPALAAGRALDRFEAPTAAGHSTSVTTAVAATEPGGAAAELAHTRPVGPRRRRSATMRTFAKSEHFDQVLANATPLMPFPALSDDEARVVAGMAPRAASSRPSTPSEAGGLRRAWPWAAAAALILGAAAVSVILVRDGGGDRDARAAAPPVDSQVAPPPALQPAAVASSAAPSAATPAASPSSTSSPPPPSTSGPSPPSTASRPADPSVAPGPANPSSASSGTSSSLSSGAPGKERRPRGQGTLQVGADPWADVYVDGVLLGQAPGTWPVPAGSHTVELRHREKRRSFRVAVDPGETEALGLVDFTRP